MERLDPALLSDAILNAPGWARLGITEPDEHIRQKAAEELAATIVDRLKGSPDSDPNQLRLPL